MLKARKREETTEGRGRKRERNLTIESSRLSGTVFVPPSKSQSLRAILFAAMAKGESSIKNLLDSPDVDAMITACRHMGATITQNQESTVICGTGGHIAPFEQEIDVGNSGIALRFLSGILALGADPFQITGDESIRNNRPMADLIGGLEQLGVTIDSNNGYAPLTIQGPMRPGRVKIAGDDSQPVSALLIAAACAKGTFEIEVGSPGEKPWVDLTLQWLERFNISCKNQDYRFYEVEETGALPSFHYQVPGDLSSAAFPVVAALVTVSMLTIGNIDLRDAQGDKKFFDILKKMGASITYSEEKNELTVKESKLRGVEVDINDCIDAIVALSVVACFAEGKTVIRNVRVAREKECDRIQAIAEELKKMGARIEEKGDGLIIHSSQLRGALLNSHGDHRMAMGLAVASLGAEGNSTIFGIECIQKTYPNFVRDLRSVGAQMEENDGE